ncbi:hypothetical protein CBR_g48781 [Chara braunii]|uniref:Peptidase M50 domain-containing protein n=1 Tax=Chara braunii TaxID=69332 RepID=A0A388M3F3_CHABU|nr:hypothetical protein CBR_g48781 [Chara braunii]|eukprot:GBG89071.1 hypothetical protein CBR_g48781 [Chara braunii]
MTTLCTTCSWGSPSGGPFGVSFFRWGSGTPCETRGGAGTTPYTEEWEEEAAKILAEEKAKKEKREVVKQAKELALLEEQAANKKLEEELEKLKREEESKLKAVEAKKEQEEKKVEEEVPLIIKMSPEELEPLTSCKQSTLDSRQWKSAKVLKGVMNELVVVPGHGVTETQLVQLFYRAMPEPLRRLFFEKSKESTMTYDTLSREVVAFEAQSMPTTTFWHKDLDKGQKWKDRTISGQIKAKDHLTLTLDEGGTEEVPYNQIEWGLEEEGSGDSQGRTYAAVAAGGRSQGRGAGAKGVGPLVVEERAIKGLATEEIAKREVGVEVPRKTALVSLDHLLGGVDGTLACHKGGLGKIWAFITNSAAEADRPGLVHVLRLLWPLGGLAYVGHAGTPQDDLKVAVAGPLTHIPMGLFWFVLWIAASRGKLALNYYGNFFINLVRDATFLNVILFCFNLLLPAYPLDGGRVFINILLIFQVSTQKTAIAALSVSTPLALLVIIYFALAGNWLGMLVGCWILLQNVYLFMYVKDGRADEHPLFARQEQQERATQDSMSMPMQQKV